MDDFLNFLGSPCSSINQLKNDSVAIIKIQKFDISFKESDLLEYIKTNLKEIEYYFRYPDDSSYYLTIASKSKQLYQYAFEILKILSTHFIRANIYKCNIDNELLKLRLQQVYGTHTVEKDEKSNDQEESIPIPDAEEADIPPSQDVQNQDQDAQIEQSNEKTAEVDTRSSLEKWKSLNNVSSAWDDTLFEVLLKDNKWKLFQSSKISIPTKYSLYKDQAKIDSCGLLHLSKEQCEEISLASSIFDPL